MRTLLLLLALGSTGLAQSNAERRAALSFDSSGNAYVAQSTPTVGDLLMSGAQIASTVRRIAAADGTVTTVAGGTTSPTPQEGPALKTYLGQLSGLAVSSDGSIAFSAGNTVGEINTQSIVQLLAGRTFQPAPDGRSAASSWLSVPVSGVMAASRSGSFYFADHCMIRNVGQDGLLATVAGTGNCASSVPKTFDATIDLPPVYAIAVDSHDTIYAEMEGNLYSLGSGGAVSQINGITFPSAIAVDSKDRLYVVQYMSDVFRVETDGTVEELHWASMLAPGSVNGFYPAIAIDSSDNVYVLNDDPQNLNVSIRALYRFTPEGMGSVITALPFFTSEISYTVDGFGGFWSYDLLLHLTHIPPSSASPLRNLPSVFRRPTRAVPAKARSSIRTGLITATATQPPPAPSSPSLAPAKGSPRPHCPTARSSFQLPIPSRTRRSPSRSEAILRTSPTPVLHRFYPPESCKSTRKSPKV